MTTEPTNPDRSKTDTALVNFQVTLEAERKAEDAEDVSQAAELATAKKDLALSESARLAAESADATEDAAYEKTIADQKAYIAELEKVEEPPPPPPVDESKTLPQVTPISAAAFRARAGLCTHPNFNTPSKVYKVENAPEAMQRVADMGFGHIRGAMPTGTVADAWAAECRKHKIGWIATCTGEGDAVTDQTPAVTAQRVATIGQKYPDVMIALEGINEPNHNRSGAAVVSNWATITASHQKAMWDAARKPGSGLENIPIVGPSLHDIAADQSYTQSNPSGGPKHYHQLKAAGILSHQTISGQHSYPGGSYPLRQLDARIGLMKSAYGPDYTSWVTEWGYHNAMKTSAGHKPVTPEVAGIYAPRAYLQFLTTVKGGTDHDVVGLCYYEHLDDSQSQTAHEERFGIEGVGATNPTDPSTWTQKAAAASMQALLAPMKDPAGTGAYQPKPVGLKVEPPAGNTDVQWQLVQNKAQLDAGTATVLVYRDKDVWSRETLTPITVSEVEVKITDRNGTRTVPVGPAVKKVNTR